MSIIFYSEPFFKGHKVELDIGRYYNLKDVIIGSINIIDNVELIIRFNKNKQIKLCGPQLVNKVNPIYDIIYVSVIHSICNPYTDKNSILNKYSIGQNYSIQFNKDLKIVTDEENKNNGFVDFWYNNQTNKLNDYYSITGGHVVPHHYENYDDYSSAVIDLKNYSLFNKWHNKDRHIDHSRDAIYNHLKETQPLVNTNNIANCKFDCGRESPTFRRKYCEMNCKANGLSEKRMNNLMNNTTGCNKTDEKYQHTNGVDFEMTKISNKKKMNIIENFSNSSQNKVLNPPKFSDYVNSKYRQYHMYPVSDNNYNDESLVTIYNGPNFEDNFFELYEGYYNTDQFNFFDIIGSIKVKDNVQVTMFSDNYGTILDVIHGPFEDAYLEDRMGDKIVAFCIKRTVYDNLDHVVEGFGQNKNCTSIVLILLVMTILYYTYSRIKVE